MPDRQYVFTKQRFFQVEKTRFRCDMCEVNSPLCSASAQSSLPLAHRAGLGHQPGVKDKVLRTGLRLPLAQCLKELRRSPLELLKHGLVAYGLFYHSTSGSTGARHDLQRRTSPVPCHYAAFSCSPAAPFLTASLARASSSAEKTLAISRMMTKVSSCLPMPLM